MDLVAAAVRVQSDWMLSVARATRGRVWVQDGVACCSKPGEMAIRFPGRLPEAALDRILAWADEHALTVGCWSAHEMPADIASTLASRGFDEGWRSHWMAIEARPAQEDARVAEATAVAEWASAAATSCSTRPRTASGSTGRWASSQPATSAPGGATPLAESRFAVVSIRGVGGLLGFG